MWTIFGKRETPVQGQVRMRPPHTGTFVVGAMAYQAQIGSVIPVRGEHVEALRAQGWVSEMENTAQPVAGLPSAEELKAAREAQRRESFLPVPTWDPIVRVLPPLEGPYRILEVQGRRYDGTKPGPQDVHAFDARVLLANGWTRLAVVGRPEDRQRYPAREERRIEGARELIFDGAAWRDVVTGEKG